MHALQTKTHSQQHTHDCSLAYALTTQITPGQEQYVCISCDCLSGTWQHQALDKPTNT